MSTVRDALAGVSLSHCYGTRTQISSVLKKQRCLGRPMAIADGEVCVWMAVECHTQAPWSTPSLFSDPGLFFAAPRLASLSLFTRDALKLI